METALQILKMPFYIYIIFVSLMEKRETDHAQLYSVLLTFLLSPICFAIYAIFTVYKWAVTWTLKRTSENFECIMEGLDSVCCNQRNCFLNILLLIECSESLRQLQEEVTQLLATMKLEKQYTKLFYSRNTFMGFHYYYKNTMKVEDYVLKVDETIDTRNHKLISDAFSPYDCQALPDDDKALMQVILFDGKEDKKKLLVFRLHHCVGDGRAIMNLFSNGFGYTSQNPNVSLGGQDKKQSVCDNLNANSGKTTMRFKDWPLSLRDDNALRGYNLLEEKHLLWFSDFATCGFMQKIRQFKRRLPKVTFLDVVNTCICSSLHDFLEKYSVEEMPRSVIGGVVLSPEVYNFKYGDRDFQLNNRFSCAAFHMPIVIAAAAAKDANAQLLRRLQLLMDEYEMAKRCVDVQFNYWTVQNLIQTIPYPLVKAVCSRVPVTFSVSSLPGCEKLRTFNGHPVLDFVFMPPNSPNCGLHFMIYTYGGDLRIVLTADKSVVREYERAEEIIDGAVKYLEKLCSHQL